MQHGAANYASYEAKKVAKVQEAERKKAAKMKQDAIAQLNMVSIPLAKFETDVQALRAADKNHVLLRPMQTICDNGLRLKNDAVEAIDKNVACDSTKDDVKKWLANCREQGKVLAAQNKSLRKGGA